MWSQRQSAESNEEPTQVYMPDGVKQGDFVSGVMLAKY